MSAEHPIASLFPPARVRIVTPRLELRLPTEVEIVAMHERAGEGIHDPAVMPFAFPWTDDPDETRGFGTYQAHVRPRGAWKPDDWYCMFGVFVDGEPVGAQDIAASNFGILREVGSGSWLAQAFHGRGLGTEMREAMLHFGFDTLGALAANSGAYVDNPSSIRVSEKCGYERNGVRAVIRSRGPNAPDGASRTRAIEYRFRLERDAWLARRRYDIDVIGVDDEVLSAFGAA